MDKRVRTLIQKSERIVFFGGAGVSTESGIPDFRSIDGIYNQKYPYPPEYMLSRTFFYTHTEEFFCFYRDKMLYPNAAPNRAHFAIADVEKSGKFFTVITQNIDGLHHKAGTKKVLELHGSVFRNYCVDCGNAHSLAFILSTSGVPRCNCGGIVKPDVVLYEEPLNQTVLEAAVAALSGADLLIIGGTSLNVYPAAGLIEKYGGEQLIIINKTPLRGYTHLTNALVFYDSIGEVLGD